MQINVLVCLGLEKGGVGTKWSSSFPFCFCYTAEVWTKFCRLLHCSGAKYIAPRGYEMLRIKTFWYTLIVSRFVNLVVLIMDIHFEVN